MSVSGNKPFVPEDHLRKIPDVKKKHTGIKPIEEKSKSRTVDDLKSRIKDDYQPGKSKPLKLNYLLGAEKTSNTLPPVAKKILSPKSDKISKKSNEPNKAFAERAKDLGFTYNKKLDMYQLIDLPEKSITIEEMEKLVNVSPYEFSNSKEIKKISDPISDSDVQMGQISNDLSTDMLEEIFSHLNYKEIPFARSINKDSGDVALSITKKQEILLLKSFIGFLAKNLDEFKDLRKNLIDLFTSNKISASKDLIELQSELLDLREKIVILFKDLKESDLNQLTLITANEKKTHIF